MNIEKLKEKQNTVTILVIFITKSLEIEILNNGAVTAPFHDLFLASRRLFSLFEQDS